MKKRTYESLLLIIHYAFGGIRTIKDNSKPNSSNKIHSEEIEKLLDEMDTILRNSLIKEKNP